MSRWLLGLLVFAGSCAASAPAPIVLGTQRPTQPAGAHAPAPAAARPVDGGLASRQGPSETARTHRVAQGESAYDIAARYQIPLSALMAANNLPSASLRPGAVLTIPPNAVHVVAAGETLRDIANAYAVDPRSLALLNRLGPADVIAPGERILLPFAASGPLAPPAAAPAAASLRWPVNGGVRAHFGAQIGGVRSDAIEIAGRDGEIVTAAAAGEVIYAGEDLPSYGVLVLVRQEGDLVATYGYLRRALVRAGQRVGAGTPLGELGPRPNGEARLLFQVRQHGVPVDPELLLPPPG